MTNPLGVPLPRLKEAMGKCKCEWEESGHQFRLTGPHVDGGVRWLVEYRAKTLGIFRVSGARTDHEATALLEKSMRGRLKAKGYRVTDGRVEGEHGLEDCTSVTDPRRDHWCIAEGPHTLTALCEAVCKVEEM